MKSIVELHDVRKTYDMGEVQVHALRGISLVINEGEFTAIMGASGSGKSTLLNILGCLDQSSGGTYILDGELVDELGEEDLARCRRTKLGFVFQSFNLLHRSTALENIELPLIYLGISLRDRLQRARAAMETVGLADRMSHMPWQLSGGQQQRVALARALVSRPRLLLADEPTGNLDSKTAAEVLDLIAQLHREESLTVILVTHDAEIASRAHRIVILHDGVMVHDQPSPSRGGPAIPPIKTLAELANGKAQGGGAPGPARPGQPAGKGS
jgi:ABC-type lipoprotein export system ATPase subunit